MKRKLLNLTFCFIGIVFMLCSCEKEEFIPVNSPTEKINNEIISPLRQPNNVKSFYMNSYSSNTWYSLQPLAGSIFPVKCVAGNNSSGLIVCGGLNGRKLKYMNNYASNIWVSLVDAPFDVIDISGDNSKGVVIAGGDNNKHIAYMNNYSSGRWYYIGNEAPWAIKGIAGDNSRGAVVYGGQENREVAFLTNYSSPQWRTTTAIAPFPIKGIAGNNSNGVVVFGGWGDDCRRIAYLTQYIGGNWNEVNRCPVNIIKIAGDNSAGPIILGGDSNLEVWYMNNYGNQIWTKLRNVPSMKSADIAGTNQKGAIVTGNEYN